MISKYSQRPSAFISSTFIDLKAERKIVTNVFRHLNIDPQALDTKPASNNSSKSEIIRGINESDFTVLIIGKRYGTIDKSFTGSDLKSITHWEYDLAYNRKIPIIAMIKNSPSESDNDPRKAQMLESFKSILTQRHSPQYFDSEDELFEKLLYSVIPAYKNILLKETQARSNLATENERLTSENQRLRSKLEPAYSSPKLGLGDILAGNTGSTASTPLAGLSSIANWGKK